MITVTLPATLQVGTGATLVFAEPLADVEALVAALNRRIPGFRAQLDDGLFSFAVNDHILLQHARRRTLADGDRVEIIPALSGG
jgi:molybdopterin converting factor small subunit